VTERPKRPYELRDSLVGMMLPIIRLPQTLLKGFYLRSDASEVVVHIVHVVPAQCLAELDCSEAVEDGVAPEAVRGSGVCLRGQRLLRLLPERCLNRLRRGI
jgi:hypothetical protein